MKFIFECSTLNECDIELITKIFMIFRRFLKILRMLSESHMNVSENVRRLSKIFEVYNLSFSDSRSLVKTRVRSEDVLNIH